MSGLTMLLSVFVLFVVAYFGYGAFLKRVFGIDKSIPCPSKVRNDGIDYIPTNPWVLFGHHFASIAGAGPIVGPIAAAYLGWGPVMLWIVIGCIFIGSMHDFAALFLSVRNEGRSIAYIIERELGYMGRQFFLIFCFATLLLVVAVFTTQIADMFLASPAVATASILFIAIAPFFGTVMNKRLLSLAEGTLVFVPLLFFCIWLGTIIPLDLQKIIGCSHETAKQVWCLFLLYYAMCASILPVWILLQPRDYLNSFLLYAMILLGIAGVFVFKPTIQLPAFAVEGRMTPELFPLLFVTIACGACSGFHAIVASGTSSKQIAMESHVQPIGYGAMLMEGLLATLAIISVSYRFTDMESFLALCKTPSAAFADGLATFTVKLGIPKSIGGTFMSLAISAFMLTTLDTATRLSRFVWQELIMPKGLSEYDADAEKLTSISPVRSFFNSRWISTLIVIIPSGWFVFSGEGMTIWPVFGSANQLLSALTLLSVSLWLFRTKKPVLFALLPMFFMIVISGWALINLIIRNIQNHNFPLFIIGGFLLVMAILLIIFSISKVMEMNRQRH